jgi:hypothetical protein
MSAPVAGSWAPVAVLEEEPGGGPALSWPASLPVPEDEEFELAVCWEDPDDPDDPEEPLEPPEPPDAGNGSWYCWSPALCAAAADGRARRAAAPAARTDLRARCILGQL